MIVWVEKIEKGFFLLDTLYIYINILDSIFYELYIFSFVKTADVENNKENILLRNLFITISINQ